MDVGHAYARNACTTNQADAGMGVAMMTRGRQMNRMIKSILTTRQGLHGQTGISQENRATGAGAAYSTQHINVIILKDTQGLKLRNVSDAIPLFIRMDIDSANWWKMWAVKLVMNP